ncbi:hypothetical protein CDAR_448501 [Caerostris darwini]|uniref:Uncharacterized protein n=1 Tax=Caerostris darwini TaxID=1538125 RepID=A0AAV4QMC3_9ARAC|nr:hypothetical protein CDAR_448501 [Caerostris darwini]
MSTCVRIPGNGSLNLTYEAQLDKAILSFPMFFALYGCQPLMPFNQHIGKVSTLGGFCFPNNSFSPRNTLIRNFSRLRLRDPRSYFERESFNNWIIWH